ncbi:autotransporter outer membrane beta-barrel domain-containing protein [Hyunsoonleella aestuarii]|uniref:Transporter n=1 Tax=Hyunsoonleella aestuarii TaxID=912802 RepID=A0ABP8E8C1_9FLAO|nr:autotransporter outer membrane beta-barrel domain-containing protein [Hyunsoonleella aestuarii]
MKIIAAFLILVLITFSGYSQDESEGNQGSIIQTYTPSKLLKKGQWDIKWFNNLYTETEARFNGVKADKNRETYFTSSFDIFTGVSENNTFNVGVLFDIRSNVVGDRSALDVFSFDGERGTARSGLTSIAPAVKFNPIKNVSNFTIQSAFHIPLFSEESDDQGVFLDQTAYTLQNRFFYDYTLPSGNWQLFTELNTEYNFGDDNSFANNTFVVAPGVFMSYFPSDKSTVLGFVQHFHRIGDFDQDFTTLGFGGKYQLTKTLNLEVLYSKFVRGENTGLGQSFNIGLRTLF